MENKEDMVGSSHILPLATEIIFTVTMATGWKRGEILPKYAPDDTPQLLKISALYHKALLRNGEKTLGGGVRWGLRVTVSCPVSEVPR